MAMTFTPVVRRFRSYQRRIRQARMVARAIKSKHHPILAHIVPMRRCNLSCAYCNEYDKVSHPVRSFCRQPMVNRKARRGRWSPARR